MKAIKFSILHFAFYIIITPILLFILSCSSPTNNPKGSLTGIVNLENQTDHSEITVALYDLAELDPDIVYANETWPHIGVIINQHTEFDHRFQAPIAVTQTEADGSFELTKIPIGTYNLVAIKDGWGFKYLLEVEILEGDNEISQARCHGEFIEPRSEISDKTKEQRSKIKNLDNGRNQHFDPSSLVFDLKNRDSDLTLFPETTLSDYFPDQSNYFLTDHHYIIEDDTVLLPSQYLEIQPGAVIRINPGVDLTIHGTIKAQGLENNMFWVTSNDGFADNFTFNILHFTLQRGDSLALYNSMELSDLAQVEDNLIEWGKWGWGNTCLLIQVNNLNMQNSIFQNGSCGFYSSNVDVTNCSNLLARNCWGESAGGIYILNNYNGLNEKNIVINNYNGIKVKDIFEGLIQKNYFFNNYHGIQFYEFNGILKNSDFISNNYSINFAGNRGPGFSGFTIEYNNFYDNGAMLQIWDHVYSDFKEIVIGYNNFECLSFYLNYRSDEYFFNLENQFVFDNCFFDGSDNIEIIMDKIIDYTNQNNFEIIISNIQTERNHNSGIN